MEQIFTGTVKLSITTKRYASYTSIILTVEATISKAHVNVPIAMYTLCIWSSWLETDIGSFIDFAFTPSLTSIDPAELGMTSTTTSSKTMKL